MILRMTFLQMIQLFDTAAFERGPHTQWQTVDLLEAGGIRGDGGGVTRNGQRIDTDCAPLEHQPDSTNQMCISAPLLT
jgi:hypothetical protein